MQLMYAHHYNKRILNEFFFYSSAHHKFGCLHTICAAQRLNKLAEHIYVTVLHTCAYIDGLKSCPPHYKLMAT